VWQAFLKAISSEFQVFILDFLDLYFQKPMSCFSYFVLGSLVQDCVGGCP
jgi:hypothetical protein